MRIQLFGLQMKMIMQKSAKVGVPVHRVRHHLHPVAGRDDHALFNSWVGGQLAASVRQPRLRDRQPLADFEWSALVIHANELKSHEAANLWIAEK